MAMRRLILRSFQSPGDVLMLTAAVRDLHAAHPGKFQTDARTSAPALWENNPYLTPLDDRDAGVERIDMHYPLIHQSDRRPYHFIHGYAQFLEERLGVKIPSPGSPAIFIFQPKSAAPLRLWRRSVTMGRSGL
jgi:hypothetical protein